jgi:hypothetical protein
MSKRSFYILLVSLFIFVVLAFQITSIFAWLSDEKSKEFDGETSDLKVTYLIWFEEDGVEGYSSDDIDGSEYYNQNTKLLEMSAGDENAENYIGKLRVQIQVETNSKYYFRMKFANEYLLIRTTIANESIRYNSLPQADNLMPYGLGENWFYDNTSDYTYYQYQIDSTQTLNLIDSESLSEYSNRTTTTHIYEYFVYLELELEYVQANRMEAIWGSIPLLEE